MTLYEDRFYQRVPSSVAEMVVRLSQACAEHNIELHHVRIQKRGNNPKLIEVVTMFVPSGQVRIEVEV